MGNKTKINSEEATLFMNNVEPVMWTYYGTERSFGYSEYSCDGMSIHDSSDFQRNWSLGDFLDYIEKVLEREGYEMDTNFTDYYLYDCEVWKKEDDKFNVEFADINEFLDWLRKTQLGNFKIDYYRDNFLIIPNTLFLSKSAAENHLKNNKDKYPEDTRVCCQKVII